MATALPPLGDPETEWRLAQLMSRARPEAAAASAAARDAWECPRGFTSSHNIGVPASQPWRGWHASSCRKVLAERSALRRRAALVEAAARGDEPPGPVDEREAEAEDLIRCFAREHPTGISWLVGQLDSFLLADEQELDKVSERVRFQVDHYGTNGDDGYFRSWARPLVERLLVLEARIPRRRHARDVFRANFPAYVSGAVGSHVEAVVSGLTESWSLDGMLPAPEPELAAAEVELAGVEQDLGKLFVVPGVEPGPTTLALRTRKAELAADLKAHKHRHHKRVREALRGVIACAIDGELPAWLSLAEAIRAHRDAFPYELAEALLFAPVKTALRSDPVVWAETLLGAVADGCGKGRESAWESP